MPKIIKVRCTGPEQHENEIDLEDVIGSDVVIYGSPIAAGRDLPADRPSLRHLRPGQGDRHSRDDRRALVSGLKDQE